MRAADLYLHLAALLTLPSLVTAGPITKTLDTFPLSEVQLLDSRFKANMERNADYLLSLDPDRLLHNTREYCGLQPKGELYGGWEKRGIAGHTLGHYLTAISQQYAATGDERFKQKIDYTIKEMAECQKAYGDGYIGALPPLELSTLRGFREGKIELKGGFNFNGAWVPWYTEHKVLAGLKDAWVLGKSEQAREVTLKLADWIGYVTDKLTPEQQQTMLSVEHGGMLETLVDLSSLTGNPRYLEISHRFYHKAVLDPLAAGKDELPGKHANTQIPKVIGSARLYEFTGEEQGKKTATNFWNLVTSRYLFAMGGNSDREHFFPADQASKHLGPETAETCNTYNMLKLTEHLMEWQPQVAYGDFYEKALYNHILASQEPEHGMFTYFVSLRPGHFKTYSTEDDSFWCCVGSGMENHTKYGEAIYFHGSDDVYVNLYIPSVLNWQEKGFNLEQKTNYPESNRSDFTIQSAPTTPLTLYFRCPSWAPSGLSFQLNGKLVQIPSKPGEFAKIQRVWKAGESFSLIVPMSLRLEPLQGDPNKVAVLYGPLLLAGDLGAVPHSQTFPLSGIHTTNDNAPTVPVSYLVANGAKDILAGITRQPGAALAFRTSGIGKPSEVILRPFKDLPYNYYNIYWDLLSPQEWSRQQVGLEKKAAEEKAEAARVIDELAPGEQQSETDHRLNAVRSETGDFQDRKYRDAKDGGFFEFTLKASSPAQVLRCTYWGDDDKREFDIIVNGKLLVTEKLNRQSPGKFFDVDYPLTSSLGSKGDLTIRFLPHRGSIAGGLFHASLLKAK